MKNNIDISKKTLGYIEKSTKQIDDAIQDVDSFMKNKEVTKSNPKGMKRIYIYPETYKKIMLWGNKQRKEKKFKTPNNRDNFPFFLKRYTEKIDYVNK